MNSPQERHGIHSFSHDHSSRATVLFASHWILLCIPTAYGAYWYADIPNYKDMLKWFLGPAMIIHDPDVQYNAATKTWFAFSTGGEASITAAPALTWYVLCACFLTCRPWNIAGSVLAGGSVINLPGRTDIWVKSI